jgi:hypothetical protein
VEELSLARQMTGTAAKEFKLIEKLTLFTSIRKAVA